MKSVRVIGPGRAGRSLAAALEDRGWLVHRLLGRDAEFGDAAAGVDLLVIATPDDAISSVAAAVEPVNSTLVAHLSGSRGLDVLAPHPHVASMHPLMTLPDAATGRQRLQSGITFATAGDPRIELVVQSLDGNPIQVAESDRVLYHAAAAIASNHLVTLAAQVERLAEQIGVPRQAYLDLMLASLDNVAAADSAADALTGPAARGDIETIKRHLAALPGDEKDLYIRLARASAALAGREPDLFEEIDT
ncbi:MAG: DUF2520 domain-containing protein [Actinomycetia bacterium]|nr:DUF2520 domain-containing protein [Actinomycetes bacterium]MCP4959603.1 DUF2520 domain-containing protein [Actinomycetes bacterium]